MFVMSVWQKRLVTADPNCVLLMATYRGPTQHWHLWQHGSFIYWTDWQTKSVERADKSSGKKRLIIRDDIENAMDIKMVAATRQTGTNTCAAANGGCSHLCLYRPQGHVCACPTAGDNTNPCSTCKFSSIRNDTVCCYYLCLRTRSAQ